VFICCPSSLSLEEHPADSTTTETAREVFIHQPSLPAFLRLDGPHIKRQGKAPDANENQKRTREDPVNETIPSVGGMNEPSRSVVPRVKKLSNKYQKSLHIILLPYGEEEEPSVFFFVGSV
jgi:hypothetical protein